MANTRRDFLKKGVGLVSLSTVMPQLWLRSAMAKAQGTSTAKTLVVLQLDGGNDGLNTVVPFTNGTYFDKRPTVGLKASDVLPLTGSIGLHPSMTAMQTLYGAQKLAIIQGVGYPQPNRSHFRSKDIWQTAVPIEVETTGWLGRYADLYLKDAGELAAINIGGSLPKSFNANEVVVPSITELEAYQFLTDPAHAGDMQNQVNAFLGCNTRAAATGDELALSMTAGAAYSGSTELQAAAGGYSPMATYPDSKLGRDFEFAAQIVVSGVGTRVLYLATGGFDTHANQPDDHADLWQNVSDCLSAFQTDIEAQGVADRVVVLVFSEFGRRVEENGSLGTDHGTAAPMFMMGTGIAGGLYGEYPSLTSLDSNGDLIYTVDFREVYADAVETWLGVPSNEILEGTFSRIGVFRS
ncbi:MAG TPA: DUF1501 domain-containing protein [Blastocatellia bacterium]|nr:DUF1501 domain-containing protein [Blastocatellia bacterium]